MYLIFNKDGSTKETLLDEYINKGSDGVNFIDVAVIGYTPDQYTASGTFTPKGQEAMVSNPTSNVTITTSSGTYLGYRFYLYGAFTQYAGSLAFSLTCHLGTATLVSYSTTLTVNNSAITSNTTITWEQYENLMNTIKNYQLQYSNTNVRGYSDLQGLEGDLSNLPMYQIFLYNPKQGNPEFLKLGIKGSSDDEPVDVSLDVSSDYVTKNTSLVSTSEIQEVPSGLYSKWFDSQVGGFEYGSVLDGEPYFQVCGCDKTGNNIGGSIYFKAKYYTFWNSQNVKIFEDDANLVYLRSSNGTSSLKLGSGSAALSAYAFNYGDYLSFSNNGASMTYVGTPTFEAQVYFTKFPTYTGLGVPTANGDLTSKAYVDKQDSAVKAYALDLMNTSHGDLQEQIDAINESQNFVATYASKADMPTPPVSTLEEKDCVLVLKDEDHEDQAYVYKYNSAGWVEVGPLGDYYTTAQIDKQHSAIEAKITALGARVDDIAKISWRQW